MSTMETNETEAAAAFVITLSLSYSTVEMSVSSQLAIMINDAKLNLTKNVA